jgi:hypothetical protein
MNGVRAEEARFDEALVVLHDLLFRRVIAMGHILLLVRSRSSNLALLAIAVRQLALTAADCSDAARRSGPGYMQLLSEPAPEAAARGLVERLFTAACGPAACLDVGIELAFVGGHLFGAKEGGRRRIGDSVVHGTLDEPAVGTRGCRLLGRRRFWPRK